MMRWEEFVGIPNGKQVHNHGYDQCVALANLYHEQVIGGAFVPVASAYQWWTDFQRLGMLYDRYTQIPVGDSPRAGDVFVARNGMYNARDGHIGVVIRDWDGQTFGTKEQNAEQNRYVWQTYNRSKANVLGFLRPKTSPLPEPSTTETETPIVFIADVRGTWYLVVPGSPKPKAIMLDGQSGVQNRSEWPRVVFTEDFAINSLRAAVDGIH